MSAVAHVPPLKPYQKNRLAPPSNPVTPEPAQLYSLVVLVLALHRPVTGDGPCGQCGDSWPCEQVRLAFRLREGF